MPHQCTNCGRTFPDGSKEMLSGCPDCGGNKFQFKPSSAVEADDATGPSTDASPASTADPASPDADTRAEAASPADASDATSTSRSGRSKSVREWVGLDRDEDSEESAAASAEQPSPQPTDDAPTDDDIIDADERAPADHSPGGEDRAQADARSATATPDEVAGAGDVTESDDAPAEGESEVIEPEDDGPDLSDLREELNDQFESIKIVNPGQYELNLMELYDRQEYIISLQEDGRYVIEVPDTWRDSEE